MWAVGLLDSDRHHQTQPPLHMPTTSKATALPSLSLWTLVFTALIFTGRTAGRLDHGASCPLTRGPNDNGFNVASSQSQQPLGFHDSTPPPPLHIEPLIVSGPYANRVNLVFFSDGCKPPFTIIRFTSVILTTNCLKIWLKRRPSSWKMPCG